MSETLYLIRGLPGSGKSALAIQLGVPSVSADDYFYHDGVYVFDPTLLAEAHGESLRSAELELRRGGSVAVANTFTCRWEMEPYLCMVKRYGQRVVVIDLYDRGLTNSELAEANSHGVPVESIAAMRSRYEFDWKSADPLPPWER